MRVPEVPDPSIPLLLGESPAIRTVKAEIQSAARSHAKVLIGGETGVGKEVVARMIHDLSARRGRAFIAVNCSGIPETLLESELFGHTRGSFTGAYRDKIGLVRQADRGTLFLDELGEMSLRMQAVLLRFTETGEIQSIGAEGPTARADVRLITATNRDLRAQITAGAFREDLYYRLSVIRIRVPSLRERRDEIPHLASFFLREACERLGKPDIELSTAALDLFAQYLWPGNVRQLRNEIQRAVALSAPGGTVIPDMLSPELASLADPGAVLLPTPGLRRPAAVSLAAAVEEVERELIRSTLDRTHGNISETARVLGLTRRGLYLKLRRLGMEQRGGVDTN